MNVLAEAGTWCCTSTDKDSKTILARIESEGMSFLTISLPKFGKDFEKSLDQGFVDRDSFLGFKRRAGLPQLFGGFLDLVFDRNTGVLLDDPSIEAIRCLRQITLMMAKVKVACSDERNNRAFQKYLESENHVKEADKSFDYEERKLFSRMALLIFGNVLSAIDRKVYNGEIIPKHGSGQTADGILGNKKYRSKYWTERLEDAGFTASEFLMSSWSQDIDYSSINMVEPGAEIPVRVITVPKTLASPRIIAMEPVAMQYAQQGLLECITEEIYQDDLCKSLIGNLDQTPNQELARLGSEKLELATLDLSEASDRVSNQHVRQLLSFHPHLHDVVDASRSRKADVNGKVIRLAKFASMGSALCFPMEAIVFCTVVFRGIEDALGTRLTRSDVKRLVGRVRIYGDDIIVPVEFVHHVIARLESYGFVVNRSKSFWTGKFRESCGKEYYDGHDVSIVKVRSILPSSRGHAEEMVSTVSTRNLLYKAGYWKSAYYLDTICERFIPLPVVLDTSPGLGRVSFLGYETEKWHPHLQSPLVKAAVVKHTLPKDSLGGYEALLKFFLKRDSPLGSLPAVDKNHLERAGRPVSVDIKHRWVSPF